MKIFFCGDVMTGRGIDQILRQPSDPRLHEQYVKDARDYVKLAEAAGLAKARRLLRSQKKLARNTARAMLEPSPIPRAVADEYIWGDAIQVWRDHKPDLRIGNLETAITAGEEFAPKGISYRMHPDNAGVLSAAGFDCLSLANNHILDWGAAGLQDTIAALDAIGIRHAGAGESLEAAQAPAILGIAGGRVLVFALGAAPSGIPASWAVTSNSPGVWLLDALNDVAVASVRDAVASHGQPEDTVIVSIHWGSNWGYEVSKTHVRFAHALIDEAGVDLIHGHSSHHPRPIEIYNGRPIFYGCGDFINDYEGIAGYEEFRGDLTLMYFVDFDPAPFTLRKLELVPLQIHRFRLRRVAAEDARWLLGSLNAASEPFGTRFELAQKDMIKVNL